MVEAAAEALYTRESHTIYDNARSVEKVNPGFSEQARDLGSVAALVVVVPEGDDDGDGAIVEGSEEHLRLLKAAEVGKVAADYEHVGVSRGATCEGAQDLGISHTGVDVGDGRNPQDDLTLTPYPNVAPP
jgi:hypothetical protein